MHFHRISLMLSTAVVGAMFVNPSIAAVYNLPPVGSNTMKATALPLGPLVPGDSLAGTVGTSSAQGTYALLSFPTSPLSIYRSRLTFSGASAGQPIRAWTFGHNQSAGVSGSTSTLLQSAQGNSPGFVQWYSFGKGTEKIPLNTFGNTAQTTNQLTMDYTRDAVTPIDGGSFKEGSITFSGTIGNDRKHLQVLDANLDPVTITGGFGLQDVDTASRGVSLTYNFAPGTYYLVEGLRNTATTLTAPATSGSRNEVLLDYPGMVMSGATSVNTTDLSLIGTDVDGGRSINIPRGGAYDVQFVQITVNPVPEPATAMIIGLAGVALLARRSARAR